jgi:hypothetical protein
LEQTTLASETSGGKPKVEQQLLRQDITVKGGIKKILFPV